MPFINWLKDWTGVSNTEKRKETSISPFAILQQVFTILGLVFSGPILTPFIESIPNTLLSVRIILILFIIIASHYVVTSKEIFEETCIIQGSNCKKLNQVYKFSESDRLIAKAIAPISLVIFWVFIWPEPNICHVSVKITNSNSIPSLGLSHVRVDGGGQLNDYVIASDGGAEIVLLPKQKNDWTLSIIDIEGQTAGLIRQRGCPNNESKYTISNKFNVTLHSR